VQNEAGEFTIMYQSTIELSPMQRVYSGRPAAQALAEEAERQGAKRVFIVASHTLANKTDEVSRLKQSLGAKCVGVFDSIAPHVPREDVIAGVAAAERAAPDMLASIGGGSVTDATKIINLCLKHGLRTTASMEPYHIVVNADRSVTVPNIEGPELPVVLIPTTLSGGEFNALSGATDKTSNVKQGYVHPSMMATPAPAMTRNVPASHYSAISRRRSWSGWRRPASRPRTSTWSFARICMSIMWAGTRAWTRAAGYPPFRRHAMCFRSRMPTTGTPAIWRSIPTRSAKP